MLFTYGKYLTSKNSINSTLGRLKRHNLREAEEQNKFYI